MSLRISSLANVSGKDVAKLLNTFQASNRHFVPFLSILINPFLALSQKLGDLPGDGIPLGWVSCSSNQKLAS